MPARSRSERFQPPLLLILAALFLAAPGWAGEFLRLDDVRIDHLESESFELRRPTKIRVHCEGAGDPKDKSLHAYGWILNLRTRQVEWVLDAQESRRGPGDNVTFRGPVQLPAGAYTAYFAPFVQHYRVIRFLGKEWGRIWIKRHDDKPKHSDRWGLRLSVDDADADNVRPARRTPQVDDPLRFVDMSGMGDDDFASKGFTLPERMQVEVYCQGEYADRKRGPVDGGWIVDAGTRQVVWEFGPDNFRHGGGDIKNKVSRETISLGKGDYVAYYATDDSHSRDGWNAPPPYDPDGWGMILWARSEAEARRIRPYTDADDPQRTLISLVRLGDGVLVTQGFKLRRAARLRLYAIGEYDQSNRQFADHALIEAFPSGAVVWDMSEANTRHAGGALKNRYADEIVRLDAGDYVLSYSTDGSHAYGAWNAAPPRDPRRWGVTLAATEELGKDFQLFDAEKAAEQGKDYMVRLVRIRSNQHVRQRFELDRPTRVRIIAVGEGLYNEMYDYGWIEALPSATWVWEMTMRNTRHAGGDEKNRLFDGVIMLDAGAYEAHYVTDDSHAWNEWNRRRPKDPNLWGITILAAPR